MSLCILFYSLKTAHECSPFFALSRHIYGIITLCAMHVSLSVVFFSRCVYVSAYKAAYIFLSLFHFQHNLTIRPTTNTKVKDQNNWMIFTYAISLSCSRFVPLYRRICYYFCRRRCCCCCYAYVITHKHTSMRIQISLCIKC